MKGLHEQGKIVRDIYSVDQSLLKTCYNSYHCFSFFQDIGFKGLYQYFGITKGKKKSISYKYSRKLRKWSQKVGNI